MSGPPEPTCQQCGEPARAALKRQGGTWVCRECRAQATGRPGVERHHVAGRRNLPLQLWLPANDHAVVSAWQTRWPPTVLRNPTNAPDVRVAALCRGYEALLRLGVVRVAGASPPARLATLAAGFAATSTTRPLGAWLAFVRQQGAPALTPVLAAGDAWWLAWACTVGDAFRAPLPLLITADGAEAFPLPPASLAVLQTLLRPALAAADLPAHDGARVTAWANRPPGPRPFLAVALAQGTLALGPQRLVTWTPALSPSGGPAYCAYCLDWRTRAFTIQPAQVRWLADGRSWLWHLLRSLAAAALRGDVAL